MNWNELNGLRIYESLHGINPFQANVPILLYWPEMS